MRIILPANVLSGQQWVCSGVVYGRENVTRNISAFINYTIVLGEECDRKKNNNFSGGGLRTDYLATATPKNIICGDTLLRKIVRICLTFSPDSGILRRTDWFCTIATN